MPDIRVRIAPSPSGYLHIGTARAALFNYLFARHNHGKFLLRIEDTDVERSFKEMVDIIFSSLEWLGLDWDEPPIYQSQRIEEYKKYVERLVESGRAYRCWCTPERLKAMQEDARARKVDYRYDRHCLNLSVDDRDHLMESGASAAVRLKIPEGSTTFHDLILGDLSKENREIDDFIIARSDGRAIYNMAVVVDDHEMRISHVIRGNDHVANTFKQILIYRALDLEPPQFAHLPLILDETRSKMSKRQGASAVTDYEKMGFLKEAVVNFIALLGWSPGGDREIMSLPEMIELFSIEQINPTNAVFDMTKLRWMNGEYIRRTDDNRLVDLIRPFLIEHGLTTNLWINTRWDWMLKFVRLMKERCHLLTEFADNGAYFFVADFAYDPKGAERYFKVPGAKERLERWVDVTADLENYTAANLEQKLRGLAEELKIKPAELIHPLRLALSGVTGGPPLFEMMELIGRDDSTSRIRKALAIWENWARNENFS
jgi:glutamyl-tRNA synthetase